MLADLVKIGASVNVCHTSMNLRGLTEQDLVTGTRMGTITGLSKWIEESQKVISF
jgi:sulfur relay (sulfurtransferase) complex TusBCD TusD component (DsrE family)